MAFSGLRQGRDLENRVAHPHQKFPGVLLGFLGFSEQTTNTFFLPIKVSLRAACKELQLNLY